jgi:hypothetical protein
LSYPLRRVQGTTGEALEIENLRVAWPSAILPVAFVPEHGPGLAE